MANWIEEQPLPTHEDIKHVLQVGCITSTGDGNGGAEVTIKFKYMYLAQLLHHFLTHIKEKK